MLCIQRRGADGKVQRRLAMSILGVDVSAGGCEHRHNCRCRCVCIRAVTARAREVQRCSCRASGDVAVRCVGAVVLQEKVKMDAPACACVRLVCLTSELDSCTATVLGRARMESPWSGAAVREAERCIRSRQYFRPIPLAGPSWWDPVSLFPSHASAPCSCRVPARQFRVPTATRGVPTLDAIRYGL